jgi:hypothetical protein
MRQTKQLSHPVPNPEREKVEERKEALPLMNCHQLSLALRLGGYGLDELS